MKEGLTVKELIEAKQRLEKRIATAVSEELFLALVEFKADTGRTIAGPPDIEFIDASTYQTQAFIAKCSVNLGGLSE